MSRAVLSVAAALELVGAALQCVDQGPSACKPDMTTGSLDALHTNRETTRPPAAFNRGQYTWDGLARIAKDRCAEFNCKSFQLTMWDGALAGDPEAPMYYEYSLFDHDEQVVRCDTTTNPEGCCAPTDGDGGNRNECGICSSNCASTYTYGCCHHSWIDPDFEACSGENGACNHCFICADDGKHGGNDDSAGGSSDGSDSGKDSGDCSSCADGTIPGGSDSPSYGYTCSQWDADDNNNNVHDCDEQPYPQFTISEMEQIRAACPASCGICAPCGESLCEGPNPAGGGTPCTCCQPHSGVDCGGLEQPPCCDPNQNDCGHPCRHIDGGRPSTVGCGDEPEPITSDDDISHLNIVCPGYDPKAGDDCSCNAQECVEHAETYCSCSEALGPECCGPHVYTYYSYANLESPLPPAAPPAAPPEDISIFIILGSVLGAAGIFCCGSILLAVYCCRRRRPAAAKAAAGAAAASPVTTEWSSVSDTAMAAKAAAEAAAAAESEPKAPVAAAAADPRRGSVEAPTAKEAAALQSAFGDGRTNDALKRMLINPKDLVFERHLGMGSFGEVSLARWGGTPVAVKKLNRNRINPVYLEMFKKECELYFTLRHPNIVQLLGGSWSIDSAKLYMVMEFCANGTLGDVLEDENLSVQLGWANERLGIAVGICRAMVYLHSQTPAVIHRDLKPENVLLDDAFNPKVADFGTSREARAHPAAPRHAAAALTAPPPPLSLPQIVRAARHAARFSHRPRRSPLPRHTPRRRPST